MQGWSSCMWVAPLQNAAQMIEDSQCKTKTSLYGKSSSPEEGNPWSSRCSCIHYNSQHRSGFFNKASGGVEERHAMGDRDWWELEVKASLKPFLHHSVAFLGPRALIKANGNCLWLALSLDRVRKLLLKSVLVPAW